MSTTSPLRPPVQSVELQVYELIRDRIVRAEYAPGSKLQLTPISEELKVSTMPVRSALKRLAAEGLVDYRPNRGAVVTPLDYAAFIDIQDIRIAIEGLAARLGAAAIADDDVAMMRDILSSLEARHDAGDLEDVLALEWQGYLVCYEASERPRLVSLIVEQGRLAERYSRSLLGDSIERTVVDRYQALVEVCAAHDSAEAERVVVEGLSSPLGNLVEKLTKAEETK